MLLTAEQLDQMVIDQQKRLIKIKDKEIKVLLRGYAALLRQLKGEIASLAIDVSGEDQLVWDWSKLNSQQARIQALLAQTNVHIEELARTTVAMTDSILHAVTMQEYAFSGYLLTMQGEGRFPVLPLLDKEAIHSLVNRDWSGKRFSNRIWDNTARLGKQLQQELLASMMRGESVAKTTRRLKELLETDAYKAERLVRSEIIAAGNAAKKKSVQDFITDHGADGIEGMKRLETLDRKTCAICRAADGRVYPMKSISDAPDIEHPNCRVTYTPVVKGFQQVSRRNVRIYLDNGRTSTGIAQDIDNYAQYQQKFNIPTYQEYRRTYEAERQARAAN